MRRALAAGVLVLLAVPLGAQGQEKVIDVRATRPMAGNSFDALWALYRKAEAANDAETSRKLFEEMRRLRIERNIRSLEEVALALVSRGLELVESDRDRAEETFRRAIVLDPRLPDGYFGLALTEIKQGVLRMPAAAKDVLTGLMARWPTSRGRSHLLTLLAAVGLLAALASTFVLAIALLLRYGTLLLHDLEEAFGPGRRAMALGVYGLLLAVPLITFQGYAWLPLWWLALLFIYTSRVEKAVVVATLVAGVLVGPVVKLIENRMLAMQNPLFRASMLAVEGGPDRRAIQILEAAVHTSPDDRDFVYLLGQQYKKAGMYDEAAAILKEIIRSDEKDVVALNNLANLEFATGEFPAAITRYKLATQAAEAGYSSDIAGTVYYNLSLAYLQKFDRQPADEARSQADRLAGGMTRLYDSLWKYEAKNENAVVDLGLGPEQVWAKFSGKGEGVGLKNVAGKTVGALDPGPALAALANRFAAFLALSGLVVFALDRWRGARMFTMRCLKCGTPFCKHCHLGAAPAGLCTQCFHLFVVRDGVSGPARNQKLMEVQKEDERRERVFRALSLVSPGAGHLYAQKTVLGVVFALVWYGLLMLSLLGGRLLPVTEAPSMLAGRWGLVVAGLLLLATYVAANRARPDFEVALPARPPRRGGRAA